MPRYENADRCYHHLVLHPGDPKRPDGRPSLLTPELTEQLIAMLRVGNYVHVALRVVGIAGPTWRKWKARARSDAPEDAPYRELATRVAGAMAEGQIRHVATISRAADQDWRAATWLLERQCPELWGAVSVRLRADAEAPAEAETERAAEADMNDPFAEVDELAQRRRQHG
jgi:hypothetical protein